MKETWFGLSDKDWSGTAAWQTLEDLRGQFKRNIDMRIKRGDIRSAVLRLLIESPMHGYQIIQEIESRSDGAWKPSPGSIYPALQLLADEGLIVASEADGRRTYALTETGRAQAQELMSTPAPWATGSERPVGPRGTLATAGLNLARVAADVARSGSAEQIEKAAEILNDAKKSLVALLKHD